MRFCDIIRSLRINSGMTQQELAEKLQVSSYTIRCWESGSKLPSAKSLVDISKFFNVSADLLLGTKGTSEIHCDLILSNQERELISMYKSLDSFGKKAVYHLCSIEKSRVDSTSTLDNTIKTNASRYIPKYDNPAAAGLSVPLDGEEFEMLLVDDLIPADADFAVKIHGDSMLPYIHDGDTVYVKRTTDLEVGNIGIFSVDGAIYCKQYYVDDLGNLTLLSANPEYKHTNIVVSHNSNQDVKCYGKVLLDEKVKLPDYTLSNIST